MPAFDHIFVIVEENHGFGQIVGSASAPFENSLIAQFGLATNYHAVTHPSVNNYLALVSGQTYNTVPPAIGKPITDSCTPTPTSCSTSARNLADEIEDSGRSWKGYMESMPSPCFQSHDAGQYTERHNPFPYFNQIRTNAARCNRIVPFGQLEADLKSTSTTPNLVWISPNLCNDMHDCKVGTADTWLKNNLPAILNSPAYQTQNSLVVITWDEDDFTSVNQVPTIVISKQTPAGFKSNVPYTHYSLLRTIEASWGLATMTSRDAAANPMTDFFGGRGTVLNPAPVPTPAPTVTGTVTPVTPAPTPAPDASIRAAFFYPWFPAAWGQLGITASTNYQPLLGAYSSLDDAAIYAQVLLAQRARLDAFIGSWWGQGHLTDLALQHILPVSQASDPDLKWAIYYEPEGQGDPSVATIVADMQYLAGKLFNQPNYLMVDGKPVVFVYADTADGQGMVKRWAQAKARLGGGLYVVLKVFPGYRQATDQPDSWHQYAPSRPIDEQLPYSVSISPGFWKVGEQPQLERDLATFAQNVAAMHGSGATWQLVTTWNDWGEGSAIEPAREFGTTYVDILGSS